MSTTLLTLILDSDLHFTSKGIRSDKVINTNIIKRLCSDEKIDTVITVGDLTDKGWDGSSIFGYHYGGYEDQVTPLINDYIKPIEEVSKLYLSVGNHDQYVIWPYLYKPVNRLVESKYGSLRYTYNLANIKFICLSIYPDDEGLLYLKEELKDKETPTILVFHYNLEGDFSDWWCPSPPNKELSDKQKEKFYEVIQGYKIIGIFLGHLHKTYQNMWNSIPVVSGAGSGVMKIKITSDFQITSTNIVN
jgi:hypothetical protein